MPGNVSKPAFPVTFVTVFIRGLPGEEMGALFLFCVYRFGCNRLLPGDDLVCVSLSQLGRAPPYGGVSPREVFSGEISLSLKQPSPSQDADAQLAANPPWLCFGKASCKDLQ